MRGVALVGTTALAVVIVVGALVVSSRSESAGARDETTLSAVAADPARYDGRSVTVTGKWVHNRYYRPKDASQALVIGTDAGEQLTVVPDLGVNVPVVSDDSLVRVRGEVYVLEAGASGARFLASPGVLSKRRPGAVLAAKVIDRPRELGDRADATSVPLERLLEDPRAYDLRRVEVGGMVEPSAGGFVLAEADRRIFVSASRAVAAALQHGEPARIQARVQRLNRLSAATLRRVMGTDDALELPAEPGRPYLLFERVAGR